MNAAEPDLPPIQTEPKLPAGEAPLIRPIEAPELIRLTPPAAFSALVREIASRSAH